MILIVATGSSMKLPLSIIIILGILCKFEILEIIFLDEFPVMKFIPKSGLKFSNAFLISSS